MRTGPRFLISQPRFPPVPPPAGATAPHSLWQSPVPYLYGGLAAMLGLISVALFIVACSYFTDGAGSEDHRDKSVKSNRSPAAPFVEQFVVVMAGDDNPSFLATPVPSHATIFNGDNMHQKETEDDQKKLDGLVDEPPHSEEQ